MEAAEPTISKQCPECGLEFSGLFCACNSQSSEITPADPLLGTVLNNTYEIQEVIGRGGMGLVYKARDILMERAVAIKMLHAHLVSDQSSIQRFQREARLASAIDHPNIITVYDFGISQAGQPYLIMDFIQGESLSYAIEQVRGLDEKRAANIFIQCCDALQTAHAKGVVHRDLKPSNIMILVNRDIADFVKIVDFGIAKALPGSGKQAHNLTQTGELFGSPLYMSPEQFLGKTLDERTDIYAMGCVMYETLSGNAPFSGEHVLETMHKHLNELPPPLSGNPEKPVSTRLEAVIMRAMEKDPDQRFQSMSELKNELHLTLAGAKDTRSFAARWQSLLSNLKRIRKKNALLLKKFQLPATITGGLLVVSLLVFFILQSDRGGQLLTLSHEGQEAYRRGNLELAEKKFYSAAKLANELYGSENKQYLEIIERLSWVYEEEEKYAPARKLITKAKGLSPEDVLRFKSAQFLAYTPRSQLHNLSQQNVLKGPEVVLKAGIKELEKYIGPTDPGLIVLYQSLAETYEKQGQFAEAEDARIKLVSIREDSQGQESIGVADARVDLANLYMEWGKSVAQSGNNEDAQRTFAEAKESYETAIKLYKELMGNDYAKIKPTQTKLDQCLKLSA
ncbi:MAG: serine/threonine-protein kinase [Candidatus Obscuribacterales bacterium]|nr:serine/threonine-protein kinase [Candidatus Obscuribacterales bacterium]